LTWLAKWSFSKRAYYKACRQARLQGFPTTMSSARGHQADPQNLKKYFVQIWLKTAKSMVFAGRWGIYALGEWAGGVFSKRRITLTRRRTEKHPNSR
jgi:hypothetical protein